MRTNLTKKETNKKLFGISWLKLGLMAIFFLAGIAVIQAQTTNEGATPKMTTPGAPAGSYALSGFENVNLFNGNLNFNLPLVKIGGRGRAQSSINLAIDSAKWEIEKVPGYRTFDGQYNETIRRQSLELYQNTNENQLNFFDFLLDALCHETEEPYAAPNNRCASERDRLEVLASNVAQYRTGIQQPLTPLTDFSVYAVRERGSDELPGYGPGILVGRTGLIGERSVEDTGPEEPVTTLTRVFFIAPDGTEYELRDDLTDGMPKEHLPTASISRGTVFVSQDGSGLRFVSDANISETLRAVPFFISGMLTFPDGTKYRIDDGLVSWIRDADGNQINFTYSGRRVTNIVDSLGRQVQISYDNATNETETTFDAISTQTGSAAWQTVKVYHTNLGNVLRGDFQLQTMQQLFPALVRSSGSGSFVPVLSGSSEYSQINEVVGTQIYNPENIVKRVELPDGRSYKLFYNPYNEIARIELPTGGAYEYEFPMPDALGGSSDTPTFRPIKERRIYATAGSKVSNSPYDIKQKYERANYGNFPNRESKVTVETYAGNANGQTEHLDSRSIHYFYGAANAVNHEFYPFWNEGKEFKSETFDADAVLKQKSETEWENPLGVAWNDPNVAKRARVKSQTSTVSENGKQLTSKTANAYDNTSLTNNQTDSWTYDFGSGSTPGRLLKHSQTSYLKTNPENTIDYTSAAVWMHGLPASSKLYDVAPDSTETLISQSETKYDEAAYPIIAAGTASGWMDPNTSVRGNATTARVWNSTDNSWLETHAQFDNFGNARKAWDVKGNLSEVEFSSAYNYGFPTKTKSPAPDPSGQNGSAVPFEATTTYDFYTGNVLSATDANGQTTTAEYNDTLHRVTKVIPPTGGAQTVMEYGDAVGNLFVKVKSQIDATNWAESTSYFDGLGRSVKSEKKDNAGNVFAETEYDNLGRVRRVSNPYRAGETKHWTETVYDAAGRVKKSIAPDGTEAVMEFDLLTTGGTLGSIVKTTDAAGKQSRSLTNGLGQLARVDEPNDAGSLGAIDNPAQATYYNYDPMGNMVKVEQGVQSRYFKYDGLGRLVRVRQPEQGTNTNLSLADVTTGNSDWSAGFTYDQNGNLLSATDTKGTTITSVYDNLNRVLSRTYSDNTPQVTYKYDDASIQYAKGKLTKTSNSVSSSQILSMDNLGRVLSSRQTTDGVNYDSAYTYNLAGALIDETYPSGRVVKNHLFPDGNLARIDTKTAAGSWNIKADNFAYNPSGAIEKLQIGSGLWETAQFNNRLQVTQLALGTSATDTSLWKLNYDFGTTDNTGNIKAQTVTSPVGTFNQSFTYDSLDRLKTAQETSGGNTTWTQAFTYDRYGNRVGFNQTIGSQTTNSTPGVDANTNRFTTGQGYTYDLAGNVIQDAQGRQFTFNGDNKQVEVKDSANNVVGSYYYDGDGKRIKKVTPQEVTTFVYSGGKLVAEYTNSTATPNSPSTQYLGTDMLGSPRVISDQSGNVISRRDFMPFGEDLTRANYGSDTIRQKFTGYEKDNETGLDFAEARYYNNQHGRFTAVDPLLASGKSADPQTFNRYSYTMNNPLNLSDPNGMQAGRRTYKGDVYATADLSSFTNKPRDGYTRYQGASTTVPAADGYEYRIRSNGWRRIGPVNPGLGDRATQVVSDTVVGASGSIYNGFAGLVNGSNWLANRLMNIRGSAKDTFDYLPTWEPDTPGEASASLATTVLSFAYGGFSSGARSTPSFAGFTSTLSTGPVTAYRVEGAANQRLSIGANGDVSIMGDTMLYLNFGKKATSESYLQTKIAGGLEGAQIKSFQVDRSFFNYLRNTSVRQSQQSLFPNRSQWADITKGPNQFGVNPSDFPRLRENIIPNSGQ